MMWGIHDKLFVTYFDLHVITLIKPTFWFWFRLLSDFLFDVLICNKEETHKELKKKREKKRLKDNNSKNIQNKK